MSAELRQAMTKGKAAASYKAALQTLQPTIPAILGIRRLSSCVETFGPLFGCFWFGEVNAGLAGAGWWAGAGSVGGAVSGVSGVARRCLGSLPPAWREHLVLVLGVENCFMRPRRLSPRILSELVQVLADGNYTATACQYVGIGESTFYEWRERGQREVERLDLQGLDGEALALEACCGDVVEALGRCPEPFDPEEWVFVVFRYQTERARSRAEVKTLKLIRNAADNSWRAAAWFLERTKPERYGLRQSANLARSTGAPVERPIVTVDELEATIERLRQQEGL